jgi:hypothetical protein
LPFVKKHVLYEAVKEAVVDWPGVFSRFRAVSTTSVSEVCSTLPKIWESVGQDVLTHIAAIIEYWPLFESEVITSLRNVP